MFKRTRLVLFVLLIALLSVGLVAAQEPVVIQWYVGLGAGGQPQQIEAQNQVVADFNATHDDIELEIILVDNTVAYDTLSTLLSSGEAPDIVGPVGVDGSNAYADYFLNLAPLVDAAGYDLSRYDEASVNFYRPEGEGEDVLYGIPFAVFPSFLYFNRDLFDEAGLAYPPQAAGEPYVLDGEELEWNIETMSMVAELLTVDINGNDPTVDGFDPENVEQFGFVQQWSAPNARADATLFGSGSFVDGEGNATIPDHWREAYRWYHSAIWERHFMPSAAYANSDLLSAGNPFNSGRVAMAQSHLWYTCCLGDAGGNWDIAVLPSYNGTITAKFHADTFRILNTTEHPEEAFAVLSYLLNDAGPTLLQVYGGLPAATADQTAFFEGLDASYPQGVNWQVALDSIAFADNPSHEGPMPNYARAKERLGQFQTLYQSSPDIDIDAEIDILVADLQAIFDEAE